MKLLGLILLFSLTAFADPGCFERIDAFTSSEVKVVPEDKVLDILENLEKKISQTTPNYKILQENITLFNDVYMDILQHYDLLLNKAMSGKNVYTANIEQVNKKILELEYLNAGIIRKKVENESSIILDVPVSNIIAEKVYEVETHGEGRSKVLKIVFSDDVVDDVFKSHEDLIQLGAKKFLKALAHGENSRSGAGINRLKVDSSIVELKITGNSVGKMRLGGYFYDGAYHFVSFSNTSEHGSDRYIHTFVDKVYSKKRARGHE